MKKTTKIKKLEEKLKKCNSIDIEKINIEEIDDIKKLKINNTKSSIERILGFINFTKNPYVIKVNGTIVKMEFSNNGLHGESCITNVFKEMYRNTL